MVPTLLLSYTVNRMALGRNLGVSEMRFIPEFNKVYFLNASGREFSADV